DSAGKTAFDHAQNNSKLKGTDAFRQLQEGSGVVLASAYAQTTDFFSLAMSGTPQDVKAAIDHGANVNAHDMRDEYQRTPLMDAAGFNQKPEVITTLLNAGADLKAQDKNGSTALIYAAGNNQNPAVITTLLKAGADINFQK